MVATFKYKKTCAICPNEFETNFSKKIYCSQECYFDSKPILAAKRENYVKPTKTKKEVAHEKALDFVKEYLTLENGVFTQELNSEIVEQ